MSHTKLATALNIPNDVVENAYASMYKMSEESRHINCSRCGFNTCEQLAASMLLDMRNETYCARYAYAKLQSQSYCGAGLNTLSDEKIVKFGILARNICDFLDVDIREVEISWILDLSKRVWEAHQDLQGGHYL